MGKYVQVPTLLLVDQNAQYLRHDLKKTNLLKAYLQN